MKKYFSILLVLMAGTLFTCTSAKKETSKNFDLAFANFENRFLDSFWKENPSSAILVGYGKYYEGLVIPDSAAVAKNSVIIIFFINEFVFYVALFKECALNKKTSVYLN